MRSEIDWKTVRRVLVVRLRSIGDTVLATPSLIALKRFLPHAKIDVLLEDWVAPLLDGHGAVDEVIKVGSRKADRLLIARDLRKRKYDVAFNLHGGTTATFFVRASGAQHRVGLASYQYPFLYNHLLSSPADFWSREPLHSAEQQLAMLGFVDVPVDDRPKSWLVVTDVGRTARVIERHEGGPYALVHPSTAFFTKQWPAENFARTAEFLASRGLQTIAVASKKESQVLEALTRDSKVPIAAFDDLSLPEITALASGASLFVGNDSGIGHIAAAVGTATVVIFGSSNRAHWRPWTDAPNEVVYEEFACQPCPGYRCEVFGQPRCIQSVSIEAVAGALDRVLAASGKVNKKAG